MFIAGNNNVKSCNTINKILESSSLFLMLFESSNEVLELKGHTHHHCFFNLLNIQEVLNGCGTTFQLERIVDLCHIAKGIVKIGWLFACECSLSYTDKKVEALVQQYGVITFYSHSWRHCFNNVWNGWPCRVASSSQTLSDDVEAVHTFLSILSFIASWIVMKKRKEAEVRCFNTF